MAKFKITYSDDETEEVEAHAHEDHGDWIDFYNPSGGSKEQVLRVQAARVRRVERMT